MKRLACGFALIALAAPAEAQQCTVTGQHDPTSDVVHVQQAVNSCDTVFLEGTFDFTGMETGNPLSVIQVLKSVNILGVGARMPTIEGGEAPFLINAPGVAVQIAGLRFIFSRLRSILVGSAESVSITGCIIERTVPIPMGVGNLVASGIVVGDPFPGAMVGSVFIMDNRIDVAGRGFENASTLPVFVNMPGGGQILAASISRNSVSATAHGIDIRNARGSLEVDRNVVTIEIGSQSGDLGPPARLVDGIRCLGAGACHVHQNQIDSRHPNSAGIRLQRTINAVVEMNDISMTPPARTTLGLQSAGVEVIATGPGAGQIGLTQRNLVSRNTIRGKARTAVSVVGPDAPAMPEDNSFVRNEHSRFVASYADVEVGAGAFRTVIDREEGTICDLGTDTIFIQSAPNCP